MSGKEKVFVADCDGYDGPGMRDIIKRGMAALDYKPSGKVFAKPNVVIALDPEVYGRHMYTTPDFVEACLDVMAHEPGVEKVDMGEKCAIGSPTRMSYKNAGYYKMVARVNGNGGAPVKAICIEEEKRRQMFLGGRVHDNVRVNRQMAEADTRVYMPRLKCHCVSKMTAAVKLNIGILCDDERSIRHDFNLSEKIADLYVPGTPDFVIMDAIDVGVGNEGVPIPRRMGLIVMANSAIAADVVGARLLGFQPRDIDYLKILFDRGYKPASMDEIKLTGDVADEAGLQKYADRIKPYDDEFFQWQDVPKELERLNSPLKCLHGPYSPRSDKRCETGCIMGVKMFLGFIERAAGEKGFRKAKPQTFVVGRIDEEIDGRGEIVWMFGSCSKARVRNAKKVVRVDKCFTTAADMFLTTRQKMGVYNPFFDWPFMSMFLPNTLQSAGKKLINGRYFQDIGHFMHTHFSRRM